MKGKRVCLVSPGHLASNPRLVKEADALHEAGYVVRVVAGDVTPSARPLDNTISAKAPWPVVKVALGPRPIYLGRRIRQELARKMIAIGDGGLPRVIWAHSPITQKLARAAAAQPADLYIGHYIAALPAAASAARQHGARLGFDAEDDHVGELIDGPKTRLEIDLRQRIEGHFLAQCQHRTAASPDIAAAYHRRYGISMMPILNVFPLSSAPRVPYFGRSCKNNSTLSIYWFSQTIGPGRGLEQILVAMTRMRSHARLSVRGSDSVGYSTRLKAIAAELNVKDKLEFLPSAPPDEMVRLAAQYDVGLASEIGTPPSRAVCLTNKIFTYLLAGIPVLLSDTPAQRRIAQQLGAAAWLTEIDNPEKIAQVLDHLAMNDAALSDAKREAWSQGQTRFNWDKEKQGFLQSIEQTLAR
jgi:glycosyltransferase involved in cell wall biosynthesis